MTCWRPASPPAHKDTTTALAVDWTDVEPSPARRTAAPTMRRPRSVLGTPQQQPARTERRTVLRLLPVRRHHDGRRTQPRRARTGPQDDPHLLPPRPGPRPGPRACPHARPRHRPRRHPRRLRLRPPRRRRLGHPAPRRRRPLVQDLHPHDRGPQGTHAGAIIANGNLYCPATPRPLWNSGHCPPTPPPARSPSTTSAPLSSPGTNSARSPPMTPTATTASPAPPPRANSAARSGPPR